MSGPLPGVLQIHGGGMVILRSAGPAYARLREELAATGVVVVGVEYRNGAGALGNHPFPTDSTIAPRLWPLGSSPSRGSLGITTITLAGESGGGNLALATTLRAKRDGTLHMIDGVYAQCPYISNAYAVKKAELPSLYENDGYLLDCALMSVAAKVYDPIGQEPRQSAGMALVHEAKADLKDLPPHVISVNQLDPLRDEGLAYARKLLDAGVSVVSRTVNGTCHGGDIMFRRAMPDVFRATVRDIKGFADSL